MRVESVTLRHVRIPLRSAFEHSAHARRNADAILVELRGDGRSGWGEIQPRAYVTGETISSVMTEHGPALAAQIKGLDVTSFDDAVTWVKRALVRTGRALATFGGFEVALLDLAGQTYQRPLGDVLGPPLVADIPAGVVIGFEVATEKLHDHCRRHRSRFMKLKVGKDDDRARLELVAGVCRGVKIRLDANGAWTADEAIERLGSLSDLPIESVEQPVPADDLAGLARVRAETGLRVMVDESLISWDDAQRIIAAGAADVFNLRLGKNGGFVATQRLAELALREGLGLHLGAMVGETGVLSRAAKIFGTRVPGFAYLEGKDQNRKLLSADVVEPFQAEPETFGLGVHVAAERLQEYVVQTRQV